MALKAKHAKLLANKLLIGRDEWCKLPLLNIPFIKAKVDTGARTSALHAFDIKTIKKNKRLYASFDIHPMQANNKFSISCVAPIIDQRYITSSNGHKENRYVIVTSITIGDQSWEIQLTLSNRDPMRYRLLLGREALAHRVIIDPAMSCNQGRMVICEKNYR